MLRTFSASSAATWQVSSKLQGLALPELLADCLMAALGILFIHTISWWATSLFSGYNWPMFWAELAMYKFFAIHLFPNFCISTGWVLHPIYRFRMAVSHSTLCYAASFFELCKVWLRAALGFFSTNITGKHQEENNPADKQGFSRA